MTMQEMYNKELNYDIKVYTRLSNKTVSHVVLFGRSSKISFERDSYNPARHFIKGLSAYYSIKDNMFINSEEPPYYFQCGTETSPIIKYKGKTYDLKFYKGDAIKLLEFIK